MRERRPGTPEHPVIEFEDFEHFETAGILPSGRFAIGYNGVPVDFLYEPADNAKATVVIFHGSTARDVNMPMFAGTGVMQGVAANRLSISDPSILMDGSGQLILSWFAGSARQPRLQFFIERVIRRVRELSGLSRLVFFGSSGGGFASLEMARRFPGCVALVSNPQVSLSRYHWPLRDAYLQMCWDGAESLSELPAYVNVELDDVYSDNLNHTVAYVQNTRDDHHIENHQLPFFGKVGHHRRVFMFMDAWGNPKGKGHVAAPREFFHQCLHELVESRGVWREALKTLGFSHRTDEETVLRTVRETTRGLPAQKVKDTM